MNLEENQRGFLNGKFKDNYNNDCSIQMSSSAMEECIWLGIDKPKLVVYGHIHEGSGIYEYEDSILINASIVDRSYKQVINHYEIDVIDAKFISKQIPLPPSSGTTS